MHHLKTWCWMNLILAIIVEIPRISLHGCCEHFLSSEVLFNSPIPLLGPPCRMPWCNMLPLGHIQANPKAKWAPPKRRPWEQCWFRSMCFSKGLVQFVSNLKPYGFYLIYIYYMIYVGFKPLQYYNIIYVWNVPGPRNLAGWYSVMSKWALWALWWGDTLAHLSNPDSSWNILLGIYVYGMILLMAEILHHLGCIKPCK